MPVEKSFIDVVELEKTVQEAAFMCRQRILNRLKQFSDNVISAKKTYDLKVNEYEKFKADIANLMTEEEVKQFIANNGL